MSNSADNMIEQPISRSDEWEWGDCDLKKHLQQYGEECGLLMLQKIVETSGVNISPHHHSGNTVCVLDCWSDVEFDVPDGQGGVIIGVTIPRRPLVDAVKDFIDLYSPGEIESLRCVANALSESAFILEDAIAERLEKATDC